MLRKSYKISISLTCERGYAECARQQNRDQCNYTKSDKFAREAGFVATKHNKHDVKRQEKQISQEEFWSYVRTQQGPETNQKNAMSSTLCIAGSDKKDEYYHQSEVCWFRPHRQIRVGDQKNARDDDADYQGYSIPS